MLNMTQIDTIRLMDQQGVPRSQIAKTLCICRNTSKKYADMDTQVDTPGFKSMSVRPR